MPTSCSPRAEMEIALSDDSGTIDAMGLQDTDVGDVVPAMVKTWNDIFSAVAPIVGHRGVAAVYGRSLRLTGHLHPWLAVADPDGAPDPDLAALETALAARPSSEAVAAGGALLQNFQALLASLLGASLTERLLGSAGSGLSERGDDPGATSS